MSWHCRVPHEGPQRNALCFQSAAAENTDDARVHRGSCTGPLAARWPSFQKADNPVRCRQWVHTLRRLSADRLLYPELLPIGVQRLLRAVYRRALHSADGTVREEELGRQLQQDRVLAAILPPEFRASQSGSPRLQRRRLQRGYSRVKTLRPLCRRRQVLEAFWTAE